MDGERRTDSGIELRPIYTPDDLVGFDAAKQLGEPGEVPYTRGVYRDMYRGRLWTMRQYAGMGAAADTNARFRYLLDRGQTGLSVAFDLPTQMGLDSDHPLSEGEVGKIGVAIDSIDDMESPVPRHPARPRHDVDDDQRDRADPARSVRSWSPRSRARIRRTIGGTVQNDMLKEYIGAWDVHLSSEAVDADHHRSLRVLRGATSRRWNTISISGYHMREAGATAVQEIAFTLANGIAYVQAALDAGLAVDDFAPRLSFFFDAHMRFLRRDREVPRRAPDVGADHDASGSTRRTRGRCDAALPHTDRGMRRSPRSSRRTTSSAPPLEALAAVLGGTQSLHTNSFDEALALPTEHAAKIALRTQQVIGYETGVASVVDPLGGSYFVESLTDELERRAQDYVERIDRMGGAVAAIEGGFYQEQIHEAAFRIQQGIESGERVVVGVNRFVDPEERPVELQTISEDEVRQQVERLRELRRSRDAEAVARALAAVGDAARGTDNLLPPMKEALRARATLGEVSDVLRDVYGEYRPSF